MRSATGLLFFIGATLPEPPPGRGYACGLPFFASMMLGAIGAVFGVGGGALGFKAGRKNVAALDLPRPGAPLLSARGSGALDAA